MIPSLKTLIVFHFTPRSMSALERNPQVPSPMPHKVLGYKLNKQGDNIQPWCPPFPIWNQSVVPCPILTVASWPAYRILRRQVRWSGIPLSFKNFPKFVVIHIVKGFGILNKGEVDVFLELSCFFDDPTDVGSLISDSSAFSKSSLTSVSSQFMYYWSLAWRILSITLLASVHGK